MMLYPPVAELVEKSAADISLSIWLRAEQGLFLRKPLRMIWNPRKNLFPLLLMKFIQGN